MPLSGSTRSDIITEMLDAGALLLGSPTLNNQIFPTMADLICYIKGLKRQNLIGQVFGSYGWSLGGINMLADELKQLGVKLLGEPATAKYTPTDDDLHRCYLLGEAIARELQTITSTKNKG
jgi:flavorubredoxin